MLFADGELTGVSRAIQEVRKLVERIARTDVAVVILGETGTGKEIVAKSIHTRSLRADKPFVAVNCGALPESLVESELFGHRKGSFTGADSNRTGLFEVADGGTLFLDEIGELPKAMQAKLLRFLENGEIRKIGDNSPTHCNVRVVCATLKNLELMVKSGDFREDLWFRINTFVIKLPSLRERREDLPELIRQLVRRFKPDLNLNWNNDGNDVSDILTQRAFQCLREYDWPGNIRQLSNTLEHALVLSDKLPIDVDSLPDLLDTGNNSDLPNTKGNILIQERNADARPKVCKNAIDSTASMQAVTTPRQKDSLSRLAANLTAFDPSINEPTTQFTNSATNLPPSLRELEAQAIIAALQRNDGNKTKAAEELGISLKTLYNKLNLPDIKTNLTDN